MNMDGYGQDMSEVEKQFIPIMGGHYQAAEIHEIRGKKFDAVWVREDIAEMWMKEAGTEKLFIVKF